MLNNLSVIEENYLRLRLVEAVEVENTHVSENKKKHKIMKNAPQTILTNTRQNASVSELLRLCNALGSTADPALIKAITILENKTPNPHPTSQQVVRYLYNILRKQRKQYAKEIQLGKIHIQLAQRRLSAQLDAIHAISGSYIHLDNSQNQTKLF